MIKPIYFSWVISSYLIQWFSTRPSNQISVLHSVLSESCVSSLLLSDLFHRINPGGLTTNMLWRGCPGWYQLPTKINHILIVVLRHMYVLYIYCMCIFKYTYIYNCVFLIHIFHDDSCTAKPKKQPNAISISSCIMQRGTVPVRKASTDNIIAMTPRTNDFKPHISPRFTWNPKNTCRKMLSKWYLPSH